MEAFRNRLSQDAIDRHFVRLAEGHKPERKGKLTLISGQSGRGYEEGPKLVMVTPTALAVEQAKSDLKRGLDQPDVLDEALERDAKRKKRSASQQARRKKPTKRKTSRSKTSRSKGRKKSTKKKTTKRNSSKRKPSSKRTVKKKKKSTNGKSKSGRGRK